MDLFGKKKIKMLQETLNNTIQSNIALEKISKSLTCLNELIIADNEDLKKENYELKEFINCLQMELQSYKEPKKEKKLKSKKIKSKKVEK